MSEKVDLESDDCHCGHEDCEVVLKTNKFVFPPLQMSQPTVIDRFRWNKEPSLPFLPHLSRRVTTATSFKDKHTIQDSSLRRIFFSPHPDDIAYSCFALASRSQIDTKNTSSISKPNKEDFIQYDTCIVTLFSKSRCANGDIGRSLKRCVKETTNIRRKEDEQFARNLGARYVSLDLPDSSARNQKSRYPELLRSTNNLASRYPAYQALLEVVRAAVRPYVEWAVASKADIHLPLAVGCHIDHWMTRVAVFSLLRELRQRKLRAMKKERRSNSHRQRYLSFSNFNSRLIFYEDLPYAHQDTERMIQRTLTQCLPRNKLRMRLIPLSEELWVQKMSAVQLYASQMKPLLLFMLRERAITLGQKANRTSAAFENLAVSQNTLMERYWILDNFMKSLNGPSIRF